MTRCAKGVDSAWEICYYMLENKERKILMKKIQAFAAALLLAFLSGCGGTTAQTEKAFALGDTCGGDPDSDPNDRYITFAIADWQGEWLVDYCPRPDVFGYCYESEPTEENLS